MMAVLAANQSSQRASEAAPDQGTSSDGRPPQKGRRRLRRLAVVSFLLAILALSHASVLRGLARVLIYDEALEGADAVVVRGIMEGNLGFDEAARLYHAGLVSQVILFEGRPTRATRMGIIPSLETLARPILTARGVPAEAITLLATDTWDEWTDARALDGWLRQHPDIRLTILSRRFHGRTAATIYGRVLDSRSRNRVRLHALAGRDHDETDWWKSKPGLLGFFDASVRLGHAWLCGEDVEQKCPWDPDAYERNLAGR